MEIQLIKHTMLGTNLNKGPIRRGLHGERWPTCVFYPEADCWFVCVRVDSQPEDAWAERKNEYKQ